MSEEIRKKINEKYPYEGETPTMMAINACKREGAEFGYQLGKDQVKAALRREIEKRNKDNDYLHQWTTSEILELLDNIEP